MSSSNDNKDKTARAHYMFKRYGASALCGLAMLGLTAGGLYSTSKVFNQTSSSDSANHSSQDDKKLNAVFNDAMNNVDLEKVLLGGAAVLSFLAAAGAGYKAGDYFKRGEAHRNWEHNYG